MQANPAIDSAAKASQKAVESTMLSPRFYTTDFAAMDRLDVSAMRSEWDRMMDEYEGDNNHDHFQRDAAFAEEVRVLMKPIDQFVGETISILEKNEEILFDDILVLHEMVKKVRPKISKNAFLVYRLAVIRSQEQRVNFSKQLMWTGGSAVSFLIMLAGLLLLLDRMLIQKL